jgi:hypothetical protein
MSIVNETFVKEMEGKQNEETENKGSPKSMTLTFIEERMFALTSFFDMLSFEGEKKKVYVIAGSENNVCCCIACITILPEFIIDAAIMLGCLIPGLFLDCCQSAIGNETSQNMIIFEKKLLKVNDEIVISNEFTTDELLRFNIEEDH